MIETVLDTNVLVATLRSNLGASYRLLQTPEERTWYPVVSPALALKYEAVLKGQAPDVGLALRDIDDFLEYLCSRSNLVQIYFRWRRALRDPNDDRILEVAVRSGHQWLPITPRISAAPTVWNSGDSPEGILVPGGRSQMNLTINISDELYQRAAEISAAEKLSIEELFASAFEERLLEFERLKEKADRGSYEKFQRVMAKVPAVEPSEYDRV